MQFQNNPGQNQYGNPSQFYQQERQNQQGQQYGQQTTTIKNQQSGQVPRVKGPEFNDRDRLNDMLATEKYLTDNFNVFAREASHSSLHGDVMQILNQTHEETRDLFNLMFQKGWYTMETESPKQINQTQQQFSNYQTQFPQQRSF